MTSFHTGHTQGIFEDVISAMLRADQPGGPEGEDYIKLMAAIIEAASCKLCDYAAGTLAAKFKQ
jgi:hypothetical protein